MKTNLYLQVEVRSVQYCIMRLQTGKERIAKMAKVSFGLMSAVLFGAICANAADSWTVGQTNPQTGSVDKNGALVYACC